MNITTTSALAYANGIKVLVYGQAGAGKTVLCATTPDHTKTIILSAEAGLLSIAGADIAVIEIKSIQNLMDAHHWLTSTDQGQSYDWICLDSISEMSELILSAAKKVVKDPRQAYAEMQDKIEDMIRAFRDLPRNVYFTAKLESFQDDTGVVRYQPMLPGRKLGQALPYFFDEVFFLRVEKDAEGRQIRYLQTAPDIKYHAKDRSGRLAEREMANLAHVQAKILGNITAQ